MSTLTNQMQAAMNERFTVKRLDTIIHNVKGAMIDAAKRIEKRPSLKGCDALEKTQTHPLIKQNKDDGGFNLMQMAVGGGSFLSAAADVATDMYANRKATQVRLQDFEPLTPKQELSIREANKNDLEIFFNMEQKLLELAAYQSCGVTDIRIDRDSNKIYPWEELATPKFNKKLSPEEIAALEKSALQFANSPHAPMKLAM